MIEVTEFSQTNLLDQEWIELMIEAKQLGLSFEEVQHFLQNGNALK
ncbi:anti-repressor SinI family protein [Metabacillus rhizolycopersici]|uniref:Anti-repressor SinI family protein n=1 Tax=Metabacillus rhizolycopersici TaxID=2875709 RepID=A0ABS7UN32_9BACI|nr:anti-repressor SinI family protein [Metabacillus rhizolycopersici]MBZ5749715.1 anti-repressor SinI family protein [Metabacillus rhizolycopersici]